MQSATGSVSLTLAEVFAGDSENEQTFYGFSDNEISDLDKDPNCGDEDDAQIELSLKEQKVPFKKSSGAHTFKLRVALRVTPFTQPSTDDDDEDAEEEQQRKTKKRLMKAESTSRAKMRRVKFEDDNEEYPAVCGSDPVTDSFLVKREQNIKANKAMLAQLMADLQKMPGGAGFLKKQAGKKITKERSSRPPRSGASGGELRKNPERVSRRQTRSMTGSEGPPATKEEEMELSLEEELLEVRRAPQRRGAPRPNQTKPHFSRPVEDITEDEIQLVADNMTDKVYNRVTGSTCHQCRQKTIDTKTCCRSQDCRGIQGQFCGPCLRNRYGEDVRKVLLDPEWKCPPCRGICNCSFCRQREGRCPTGILFPLAQYHGFSDVHSYLSSLRNKLRNENE